MIDVAERDMAKAKRGKGRPKVSARDDVSVKLDRALTARGKVVAGHRGISLAELLTELLQTPMDRAYTQMVRELAEREEKSK